MGFWDFLKGPKHEPYKPRLCGRCDANWNIKVEVKNYRDKRGNPYEVCPRCGHSTYDNSDQSTC